jgi:hypothetical protein
MTTTWRSGLDTALESGEPSPIWAAYKAAWSAHVDPPMDGATFRRLFNMHWIAREATELVRSSSAARKTLRDCAEQLQGAELLDEEVCLVFAAVIEPERWTSEWLRRRSQLSLSASSRFTRSFIEAMLAVEGRDSVREILRREWRLAELREEEIEVVVKVLADNGALTRELLDRLGPAAEAAALRLSRRNEVSNYWDATVPPPAIDSATASPAVCRRVAALLQVVRVSTDVRDAGLRPEETGVRSSLSEGATDLVDRLERYANHHAEPEFRRLSSGLRSLLTAQQVATGPRPPSVAVPLIRLLHLRLILEASSLLSALARPEEHVVPDVVLYLLGSEAVTYLPELRIAQDSDRRWRARWVESTGEALATIFLEETVGLKLPTLRRIPERREATPDFMAEATDREPIVFETKGSTDWKTHLKQRRKALHQLLKAPRAFGAGTVQGSSWSGSGRAFACCLLASLQGAESSSLFHVADPTFSFLDLFHEGWRSSARRYHYDALLRACDKVLLGEGERRESRDAERFSLQPGENGPFYRGRFDRLEEVATRLGHPAPESFRGVRIFRGLDEDLYRVLSEGSLPSEDGSTRERGEIAMRATAGAVYGERGAARGVYSHLSDGAVLAVDLDS